jgi:hypothetical protein
MDYREQETAGTATSVRSMDLWVGQYGYMHSEAQRQEQDAKQPYIIEVVIHDIRDEVSVYQALLSSVSRS